MNNDIMKWHGKYRILAHVDEVTKDFPKDENGEIEESYDDLYIPCKNKNEIHSAGNKFMSAIIYSTRKATSLLELAKKNKIKVVDYDILDGEAIIIFNSSDMKFFADYLGAETKGARLDPYNLNNNKKS